MIKLVDLFEQKYNFLTKGVPDIEVGEYLVQNYVILDNDRFVKTVYFITDQGTFKTVSRAMIRSLYSGLGVILQEQFSKGESVLIEFVNKRTKSGQFGLGFRLV